MGDDLTWTAKWTPNNIYIYFTIIAPERPTPHSLFFCLPRHPQKSKISAQVMNCVFFPPSCHYSDIFVGPRLEALRLNIRELTYKIIGDELMRH